MDRELKDALRAVEASPADPGARARLAVLQARRGEGIRDVDRQHASYFLDAPWLSTDSYAFVWIGFKECALLRPGKLEQVGGYRHWFGKRMTMQALISPILDDSPTVVRYPATIGRWKLDEPQSWIRGEFEQWQQKLVAWCVEPTTDAVVPGAWVFDERNRPVRRVESGKVRVARTKETWSIEHVRLAAGLDPMTLPNAPDLRNGSYSQVRVGTCHKCHQVQGRQRASGATLCYDCWRNK